MNTSSRAVEKSWLHHKTSLKCAVNANPPANFTWFKDDRPILDGFNSSQDISTLTLTPKTAGDFGLYSCKATNNKGSAWHNITLAQLCKYDSLWRKATLKSSTRRLSAFREILESLALVYRIQLKKSGISEEPSFFHDTPLKYSNHGAMRK